MNLTLLDETIAALDQCRNGTSGSFGPLNVTVQDLPTIPTQIATINRTIERRATDGTSSVTWPCPTFLYFESSSYTRNSDLNLTFLVISVIAGCAGLAYGMAW